MRPSFADVCVPAVSLVASAWKESEPFWETPPFQASFGGPTFRPGSLQLAAERPRGRAVPVVHSSSAEQVVGKRRLSCAGVRDAAGEAAQGEAEATGSQLACLSSPSKPVPQTWPTKAAQRARRLAFSHDACQNLPF